MNLAEQLRRDEGCVLHPYPDSLGFWTVGVGHKLLAGDSRGPISQEYADQLLTQDIALTIEKLYRELPWVKQLDGARQGCLLNMAFNMGVAGLVKFSKTLQLVHSGEFSAAGREMLKSVWAAQVGIRAKRLSQQMTTGEWV